MDTIAPKEPLLIIFSNLGLGGIQRKIVDICNVLSIKNPSLPIHIVLRRHELFSITRYIKNPNVSIHVYKNSSKTHYLFGFSFYVLKILLKFHPYTILTFLSPFSLPVIMIKKLLFWKKYLVIVNEDHFTSGIISNLQYSFLNKYGIKALYKFADAVISPTKAAKADLVRHYSVPENNIHVIPNWTTIPVNTTERKTWDITYAGRFVKQKNVFFLLRTIKALVEKGNSSLRVCLIGDGPEKQAYSTFIKKNHLSQIISIIRPTYHVERVLQVSRFYVCSSEKKGEGFPLAILDAMASGAIILSTDFYGANEVIQQGKNGYIIRDEKELQTTIETLRKNTKKQKQIVHNALNYVTQYHSSHCIKKYLHLLQIL